MFFCIVEIYWTRIVVIVLKSYVKTELRLSWVCPITFSLVSKERFKDLCLASVAPCLSVTPMAPQLLFPHPSVLTVWSVGQGTCMSPVALCAPDQDAVHTPTHPAGAAFLEIARNSLPSCLCHSSSTLGRPWARVIQQLKHRDFDVYVLKPLNHRPIEHESGKLCGKVLAWFFGVVATTIL